MRVLASCALALVLAAPAAASISECGSEVRSVEGRPLDLAPPQGYVDVCAHDQQLCQKLTKAYPPSLRRLGYFVPRDEWEANKDKAPTNFRRYLIALLATNKKAAQLAAVKERLRSQVGAAPDAAQLMTEVRDKGQASLGILEDSPDAFAFGAVGRRDQHGSGELLAMTNSAMVLKEHVLSLYVSATVSDAAQVDAVKAITKQWLGCLRSANP
jgi:hypothetical protein